MSELRRDPIIGRWIIVSTEKELTPADFEVKEHLWKGGNCPFCPGNEQMTPPEIDAHRPPKTKPNTSGWSIRVIPNKFPALQSAGDLTRAGIGVYDMMNGIGAHEVIIENPDHEKDLWDLKDKDLEVVIRTYRGRCMALRKDPRLKYILMFKNYGRAAGASLKHSHTQLIALPIIPKRVNEEIKGSAVYYEYKERCVFCDIIVQELKDKERIIAENKSFLLFTPFASCFPFEAWIIPKKHSADFDHTRNGEIPDLASILREGLNRMKALLQAPAYNFIIHTSPIEEKERKDYHWHIEIMPRLTRVAGYEWGTGFYVIPTSPEKAAKYLREVKL